MSKGLIETQAGSMSTSEEITALLKTMTAEDYREAYLDYTNNFLTYDRFRSYYGLTAAQAASIIDTGRVIQGAYATAMRLALEGI